MGVYRERLRSHFLSKKLTKKYLRIKRGVQVTTRSPPSDVMTAKLYISTGYVHSLGTATSFAYPGIFLFSTIFRYTDSRIFCCMISSLTIRAKYLEFFRTKSHAILPSAPLVPENDPSVLFNTAGMQPLVPYLLGEPHPLGKRLSDVQKCVRTGDIDDVGDDTHLTFFEMLGNWSLGDYFKKESIEMSWEFLTSPEWLSLDPRMISVTVFEGDANAPRDEESANIWKSLGMPNDRIAYLPAEDNWWAAGPTGPCGPDTEIFYYMGE
jgi:hypothetical protein